MDPGVVGYSSWVLVHPFGTLVRQRVHTLVAGLVSYASLLLNTSSGPIQRDCQSFRIYQKVPIMASPLGPNRGQNQAPIDALGLPLDPKCAQL